MSIELRDQPTASRQDGQQVLQFFGHCAVLMRWVNTSHHGVTTGYSSFMFSYAAQTRTHDGPEPTCLGRYSVTRKIPQEPKRWCDRRCLVHLVQYVKFAVSDKYSPPAKFVLSCLQVGIEDKTSALPGPLSGPAERQLSKHCPGSCASGAPAAAWYGGRKRIGRGNVVPLRFRYVLVLTQSSVRVTRGSSW